MFDTTATTAAEQQTLHGKTDKATRAEVGAQVLQNFAGGCGVAIAIAALQSLVGVNVTEQWKWPVYIGALAFGAAMAIRMHLDEYKGWHNMHAIQVQHRAEMETLTELCDRLEEERDDLRTLYETQRTENNRLSNELAAMRYQTVASNTSARHVPIQDTFSNAQRADARTLIKQWYATGAWPGERTMQWTRSRHSTARDLLLRAAVLADGKPQTAAAPPESEAWALAKLDAYLGNTASTASPYTSPRRGVDAVDAVGGAE